MYNEYQSYTAIAGDMQELEKAKISMLLKDLKNLTEFNDVKEYIENVFGNFAKEGARFSYPNNTYVYVKLEENLAEVFIIENDVIIFSKGWKFFPEESEEN